jgi:hypothetical protein
MALGGISDNHQRLCFALAFWNGKDPILKERLYGVGGHEGNHGEDIKEYYFYLDNTPTHAYMKYLYKYPHQAFPYSQLLHENQKRNRSDPEWELMDTGIFEQSRYWDILIEYAKKTPDDLLIQITVNNRGPQEAELHLLPTLWFRNTWSWNGSSKPNLKDISNRKKWKTIHTDHPTLGKQTLFCEEANRLLFTENETNFQHLFGTPNRSLYTKDAFHHYVIDGKQEVINPQGIGTKAGAYYRLKTDPGKPKIIRLRLTNLTDGISPFGKSFSTLIQKRKKEANGFYEGLTSDTLTKEMRMIQRQAFSGMLWNKQFYHYIVEDWLKGDSKEPEPPGSRKKGRNKGWPHLYNEDILSLPDKWEYPWFASWDLAFHVIPFALIDPDFAKKQLLLLTREWYMHPNGQIPAYEWGFGNANPPVHAWAAWRVYKIEKKQRGKGDRVFLERVFQKLLLNFTWWINRKDTDGKNIFQGGFLGLDNISVFDRNEALPTGGHLEQSDGTSWMACYSLHMLRIALELAKENPCYEDIASKFFEHFLYIANAMNHFKELQTGLWNEEDGFFYDVLQLPDGSTLPLKVRSMVGIIPLFAIETLEPELIESLPGFKRRLEWFITNRPDLSRNVASMEKPGVGKRRILSVVNPENLRRLLHKILDEEEFLSPFGIRSLSKYHEKNPFVLKVNGHSHEVQYEPGESKGSLFGGNSNWRGPVWFPVNFLLLEALQKFHFYLGNDFKVECPTGSGHEVNLWEVSTEISHRMIRLFLKNQNGNRPINGENFPFHDNPHWRDHILFYEHFHGDQGQGLGASHQTGWTGLVAKLIQQCGEYCGHHKPPKLT